MINKQQAVQLLIRICENPRKYTHVVNVPTARDAAEWLRDNYANKLTSKQRKKISAILR